MSEVALERSDLRAIVPEGTDPPGDIDPAIFASALERFLACRRLDMRALAGELEISRATLYRRVRGRDHLLGEVLWFLTRHAIARALADTAELSGRERVLENFDRFVRDIHARPALHRFLAEEPEAALRILTSKHGPIQPGLIEAVERLIRQEIAAGEFETTIEPSTLAFVIIRIGESFMYADTIADNNVDLAEATEVVCHLI